MTLHDAIIKVLIDSNKAMTAHQIADEINAKNLYFRKDKKPVPSSQIDARIINYSNLFAKSGNKIDLISRKQQSIDILLNKTFVSARNKWAHGILTTNSQLLIPLCFFYKRVIDNKELLDDTLKEKVHLKCDLNDFYKFLNKFSDKHINLRPVIQRIISDLENDIQANFINEILLDLSEISLRNSVFPENEFSLFYHNLILKLSGIGSLKGQFSTPEVLSKLIARLAGILPFKKLYNPAAGIGTLPVYIKKAGNNSEFVFLGEEIYSDSYLLAITNLIINKINPDHFYLINTFNSKVGLDDFDLIVCNPPFMASLDKHDWPELPGSGKSHIQFLQYILTKLTLNRAIILMPESFFFSNGPVEVKIKQDILGKNLLEGIISLPPDIMRPYSSIKTSLLVLNGNKKTELSYLIDAENTYFRTETELKSKSFDPDKIFNVLNDVLLKNTLLEDVKIMSEPLTIYNSGLIALQRINKNNTNLTVKRLLIQEPEGESGNPEMYKLRAVFEIQNRRPEVMKAKYVSIRDLNTNYYDFKLNTESIDIQEKSGISIKKEAILLGSTLNFFKPTYHDGSESILVSPNIYILTFRESFREKINPEYLIHEFASKPFMNRLDYIAVGSTSNKRILRNDLLNIEIFIPELREQNIILEAKKEILYNDRINDAAIFARNLGILTRKDINFNGFIEHELNNVLGGVNLQIGTLKSFLARNNIDFGLKLSGHKNSLTLKETFKSLESNILDVKNLFSNIAKIFDIENAKLNMNETAFSFYIREECLKQNNAIHDFEIYIGIDDNYAIEKDAYFFIDQNLFSLLVLNFLLNSAKHGYNEEDANKILVFNLTQDEDYHYVNLINNGKPFPESFSPDSFVEFGKRSGANQGSGLGGFIMAEIAKKHGGELAVIADNEILSILVENRKIIIQKAVHFQIKLPKNL